MTFSSELTAQQFAGTILSAGRTMSATLFSQPEPTPATAEYWIAAAAERLVIPWCPHCGAHRFPPRWRCPQCWTPLEWREVSGRGHLSSFVIVRRPIDGLDRPVPYVAAVVRLVEGVDVMSNLVDFDPDAQAPAFGLAVRVVFRSPPGGVSLPLFRPDTEA